jgi:hypothetical protein
MKNTKCKINFDTVKPSMTYDERKQESSIVLSDLALDCQGEYFYTDLTNSNAGIDENSYLCNVDYVAMNILVSVGSPEYNSVIPTYEVIDTTTTLG